MHSSAGGWHNVSLNGRGATAQDGVDKSQLEAIVPFKHVEIKARLAQCHSAC